MSGEGETDQADPDGPRVPQTPHRQAIWFQVDRDKECQQLSSMENSIRLKISSNNYQQYSLNIVNYQQLWFQALAEADDQ